MTRIVCLTLLGLLATMGVALSQNFQLEHFQCYTVLKTDPTDPQATVGLLDQFRTGEEVDVRRVVRFCNPTRKYHQGNFFGVEDIRQHLTMYATFPQGGPLRIVVLNNQFGQQVWRLRQPVALAVPTHKPPHDPPQGLDHFRCYAASGPPVAQGVALSDQFILPLTGHFVIDPVAFCNPVQKRHNNVVTEIQNPDQHLACYSMTRVPFSTERSVRNQFGPLAMSIGFPDTLCVPTRKIDWRVIPDGPIGAAIEDAPRP